MIKAIIFDCWGTLFTTAQRPAPFQVFADAVGQSQQDPKFYKAFERHLMTQDYDDPAEPLRALLKDLGITDHAIIPRLQAILTNANNHHRAYPETITALHQLNQHYQLGLLTNTTPTSFESLSWEFKLSDYFDVVLPSYQSHLIKPDPAAFRLMLDRLGVKAGEAVMVGDSLKDDIEAASAVGIAGILLDRRDRQPGVSYRIKSLSDLYPYLRSHKSLNV